MMDGIMGARNGSQKPHELGQCLLISTRDAVTVEDVKHSTC